MEKRIWLRYLVLTLIFVSLISLLWFMRNPKLVGFVVYEQPGDYEFSEGSYSNTEYNGTAVILSGSNLTGTYTSKIFDCGSSAGASWNNISWSNEYYQEELLDNQQGDLMSGNVLLLHMNDESVGANPVEDSKGSNDGSAENGANVTTSGKLNNAGNFDGVDDYIDIGSSLVDESKNFTVLVWMKHNGDSYDFIVAEDDSTNRDWFLSTYYDNKIRARIYHLDGSTTEIDSDAEVYNDDEWHQVGTVVDTSSELVFLILDGEIIKNQSFGSSGLRNNGASLTVGWGYSDTYAFNGNLDEVAIYNKILDETEISSLYNSGDGYEHTGSEDGLVSVWHMNEDTWQDKAEDTSGNDNDGIAYGNPSFQQSGKLNYSISFDGSDDVFDLGNVLNFEKDEPFSFGFWLDTTASGGLTRTIFSKLNQTTLTGVQAVMIAGKVYFGIYGSSAYYIQVNTNELYNDGNWHYFVLSYDGSEYVSGVNVYADGVLKTVAVTKDALHFATTILNTENFYIGKRSTGNYYLGSLDELAVWNRALSESEIKEIYAKGALKLNLSARSCDDSECSGESFESIGYDSPKDFSGILDNNRYFQYKFDFETESSAVSPALQLVTIDYTVLNTAPTITLVEPQDGATYGYNESIDFEFSVSDDDENIDSCWYVLNSEDSVLLVDCANTTIDVPEGSNTLTVYVNDTGGEEASDSTTFNVDIGAPTIVLNSPINSYLNSQEVTLSYIPTDVELELCELWGDWNGGWNKNQTDFSPDSGSENTFSVTLEDGTYLWNIRCNDSLGNSAFNGNKTFYIDTISPEISVSQPTGTKTTRTDIPIQFSASDNSTMSCWYNVYRAASIEVFNTSINCTLGSGSFSVTVDADFYLNFYVNDSADNSNSASSNFSVDTSSPSPSPAPSSGGGGGGSFSRPPTKTTGDNFSASEFSSVVMRPGETKTLSLEVRNVDKVMQNNCKLSASGDYSGWILSSDEKDINANEKIQFIFTVEIPSDAEVGDHQIPLIVKCQDVRQEFSLELSVLQGGFQLLLREINEADKNKLSFNYAIRELNGKEQEISLLFSLVDSSGDIIAEKTETILISPGETKDLSSEIEIPFGASGDFDLIVEATSEGVLMRQSEAVLVGKGVTGFASIFTSEENRKWVSIVIFALFGALMVFLVFRSIRNSRKSKKGK